MANGRSVFCTAAFLLLFCWRLTGGFSEMSVSLEMPNFASRGSSVVLHCQHNVKPDLLYKVEWLRNRDKIFQYVRERTPPFKNYSVEGAVLNMSRSNESCVVLEELEFSASGSYSCEVSSDVPIYTKASAAQDLLVIQPQRHPPKIVFGSSLYSAGEPVEANCTTGPAHPAPSITWFVNGVKVDAALTRGYTRLIPLFRSRKRHRSARSRQQQQQHTTERSTVDNNAVNNHHHHHHHREQQRLQQHQHHRNDSHRPPSEVISSNVITTTNSHNKTKSCSAKDVYGGPENYQHNRHSSKQTVQVEDSHQKKPQPPPQRIAGQRLSVSVSALRLSASGRLSLSCLATIPPYPNSAGKYADYKNHTVIVDVVVAEELEPEPTEPPPISAATRLFEFPIFIALLNMIIILLVNFPIDDRLYFVNF